MPWIAAGLAACGVAVVILMVLAGSLGLNAAATAVMVTSLGAMAAVAYTAGSVHTGSVIPLILAAGCFVALVAVAATTLGPLKHQQDARASQQHSAAAPANGPADRATHFRG